MNVKIFRKFYWQKIRRYKYEICQNCGKPVSFSLDKNEPRTYWSVYDDLWFKVIRSFEGILRPRCFTHQAHEMNIHIWWEAKGME